MPFPEWMIANVQVWHNQIYRSMKAVTGAIDLPRTSGGLVGDGGVPGLLVFPSMPGVFMI